MIIIVSDSETSSEEAEESEYEGGISDEFDDENKESSNESDDDLIIKNEGWADSIAKILGSNKPKNKKTLVLSRAKKLADIVKKEKEEKPSFEVVGDKEKSEIKPDISLSEQAETQPPAKKKVRRITLSFQMLLKIILN